VEVRPEAILGAYKCVEVPRPEVEISEEDVEDRIEDMQAQFATLAAVEGRPVQEGDFVILDFKGERLAGGPLEGAEAEDYLLEIGGGELLPDFEENIVGMNANERKQFGVTFPMDYDEETLRGQSVLFNVHVKEIKERDLPPLDDEFVKEASEFETLNELRVAVREELEATAERRAEGEFRARVLDVVAEGGKVEVPEVMVHEKAHEMVESFERSISSQGMDPEQYYELAGADHAAFEERVMPDAEDTVRKELVLDAVATAEGIVADEDEVMHEIGHLAEDSERSVEEIARTLRDNGTFALLEEEISRQKALDFLVENAVPVPMPEEEIEEEEPADEEEPVEASATKSEEREEQQ
jgi:trigger factor